MGRRGKGKIQIMTEAPEQSIAKTGGERRVKAMTERQPEPCKYCGHDGGNNDEVAQQAELAGVSGFACVDEQACAFRIRQRYYGAKAVHLTPDGYVYR